MTRPMLRRRITVVCPNCKTTRVRKFNQLRQRKITRLQCRDCGKFAPWYRWSFDNPNGLPLA